MAVTAVPATVAPASAAGKPPKNGPDLAISDWNVDQGKPYFIRVVPGGGGLFIKVTTENLGNRKAKPSVTLVGPVAGARSFIGSIRREVGTSGPDDRAGFGVDTDLSEPIRGARMSEHRPTHAVQHVEFDLEPVSERQPRHAVRDNGYGGDIWSEAGHWSGDFLPAPRWLSTSDRDAGAPHPPTRLQRAQRSGCWPDSLSAHPSLIEMPAHAGSRPAATVGSSQSAIDEQTVASVLQAVS